MSKALYELNEDTGIITKGGDEVCQVGFVDYDTVKVIRNLVMLANTTIESEKSNGRSSCKNRPKQNT